MLIGYDVRIGSIFIRIVFLLSTFLYFPLVALKENILVFLKYLHKFHFDGRLNAAFKYIFFGEGK